MWKFLCNLTHNHKFLNFYSQGQMENWAARGERKKKKRRETRILNDKERKKKKEICNKSCVCLKLTVIIQITHHGTFA